MTTSFLVSAAIAAALLLGLAVLIGTTRFRHAYEEEKKALLLRSRAARVDAAADAAPASLPPLIRRYLAVTASGGKPVPRVAFLGQTGALRAAADKPWLPFEAEQAYGIEPPGFVWLARARLSPFVPVMARDKFADGKGHMLVRLLGLFTVADGRGPEMDQGAGLRFWGEVIAFPEVVLSRHLRWEPVDDQHVRFIARHDGLELTATVEFDTTGLPAAVHADRFRDVAGKPVLTAWSGYFRDWGIIDGRLFPARWESAWHLPDGDFTAVKMGIDGVETE